jgi:hypothetical protein
MTTAECTCSSWSTAFKVTPTTCVYSRITSPCFSRRPCSCAQVQTKSTRRATFRRWACAFLKKSATTLLSTALTALLARLALSPTRSAGLSFEPRFPTWPNTKKSFITSLRFQRLIWATCTTLRPLSTRVCGLLRRGERAFACSSCACLTRSTETWRAAVCTRSAR